MKRMRGINRRVYRAQTAYIQRPQNQLVTRLHDTESKLAATKTSLQQAQTQLYKHELYDADESISPPIREYGGTMAHGEIIPPYGNLSDAYHIYECTPEMRAIIDQKTSALTRNGMKIVPYYYYSCIKCGQQYNSPTHNGKPPKTCDMCGRHTIRPVNYDQRLIVQEWFDRKWTRNPISKIQRICGELAFHMHNADTTYLVLDRLYNWEDGQLTYDKVEYAYVPHPDTVHIIGNSKFELGGIDPYGTIWVCANKRHRHKVIISRDHTLDDTYGPECSECDAPTIQAWGIMQNVWGVHNKYWTILGKGEIIPGPGRYKKYGPYGFPPRIPARHWYCR